MKDWIVGVLLCAALATLAFIGAAQIHKAGHRAGAAEVQARWDRHQSHQIAQLAADLLEEKQRADTLQIQLYELEATRQSENDHAQAEHDDLRLRLRTGAVRLSVPTVAACPAQLGAGDVPQGAAPAGQPAQARAELDPATADRVLTITRDGDSAIRDLNACIDRYDTVRAALNAARDVQSP